MRDALRLAFGTLTVLPVRPPTIVDRRTAGRAMALAPLLGFVLALMALTFVWVLGGGSLLMVPDGGTLSFLTGGGSAPRLSSLSPMVGAVVVVATLALLTRGLHLDGLADTADGLGSAKPPAQALEVMRRSDIGPFGVVTLLLVLLLQVACVDRALQSPFGVGALAASIVLSRLALPLLCSAGVQPARTDGLGSTVAESVTRPLLVGALLLTAVLLLLVVRLVAVSDHLALGGSYLRSSPASVFPDNAWHTVGLLVVPLVVTALFARHCVRRLGGITGDVLGACVEIALTAALLVTAI